MKNFQQNSTKNRKPAGDGFSDKVDEKRRPFCCIAVILSLGCVCFPCSSSRSWSNTICLRIWVIFDESGGGGWEALFKSSKFFCHSLVRWYFLILFQTWSFAVEWKRKVGHFEPCLRATCLCLFSLLIIKSNIPTHFGYLGRERKRWMVSSC